MQKTSINLNNCFSFPEGARQDQGTMEEGRSPEEATQNLHSFRDSQEEETRGERQDNFSTHSRGAKVCC